MTMSNHQPLSIDNEKAPLLARLSGNRSNGTISGDCPQAGRKPQLPVSTRRYMRLNGLDLILV